MGCCLSTKSSKAENHYYSSVESCKNGGAPPLQPPSSPPLLEEETVKEVVLSETPMSKLETLNVTEDIEKDGNKDSEVQEVGGESAAMIKQHSVESTAELVKPNEEVMISEVSEYSEMCSFTESLSTTTAPEKRDDDDEVNQRSPARVPRRPRSYGEGNCTRKKGAMSPGRRPAQDRRGQVTSSRASQGRQLTGQRRNVGPVNNLRRGSGEYPDRRSISPTTGGNVGMRQNVRQKSVDLSEKGPGGSSPARRVKNAGEGEEKRNNDVVPKESSESLENPVVSLECFIFL